MSTLAPNAQYSLVKPRSLSDRIVGMMRRRMYESFLAETGIEPRHTIIDIGATSDQSYEHSNYIEAWYPYKDRITAVGIDDASFLERKYPGVRFRRADGRALPFPDRAFDFAHSNAVIEHVGSRENQVRFVAELLRVARVGVFLTTPNRWYPIEFHTVLPLLHWLPAPIYRRALRGLGKPFFAEESNLNLMSKADLQRAARKAGVVDWRIAAMHLGGIPSNLILIARKQASQD